MFKLNPKRNLANNILEFRSKNENVRNECVINHLMISLIANDIALARNFLMNHTRRLEQRTMVAEYIDSKMKRVIDLSEDEAKAEYRDMYLTLTPIIYRDDLVTSYSRNWVHEDNCNHIDLRVHDAAKEIFDQHREQAEELFPGRTFRERTVV